MPDSKLFKLKSDIPIEMIVENLQDFLNNQKSLKTETFRTDNGFLIQTGKAEEFKVPINLRLSFHIQLIITDDNFFVINIGYGQWIDHIKMEIHSPLRFTPLLSTSIFNIWDQNNLTDDIMINLINYIRSFNELEIIVEYPNSILRCPNCCTRVEENYNYCVKCGDLIPVLVRSTCSQCRTKITPDQDFCFECGASIIHVDANSVFTAILKNLD